MLVVGTVFFADHPGRVDILWQGWRVETSVAVLAAAAILAALVAALLFSLLSLIVETPRKLLRARRQRLHAAIGAILEREFPEIVAAQPELLAHHCAEAGLTEQAVRYWQRAGERAT